MTRTRVTGQALEDQRQDLQWTRDRPMTDPTEAPEPSEEPLPATPPVTTSRWKTREKRVREWFRGLRNKPAGAKGEDLNKIEQHPDWNTPPALTDPD